MPRNGEEARTAVLEACKRLPAEDLTARNLALATGIHAETCRRHRDRLLAEGLIARTWTRKRPEKSAELDERDHDHVQARIEAVRSTRLLLNAQFLDPKMLAAVLP